MTVSELDNFVSQFKNLWRSGLDSHLDLECHAGQAWVGIRVRLGPGEPLHIPPQRKFRDNPSRQRRRARRAAARQQEGAEEAHQEAEQVDTDGAVEAEQSVVSIEKQDNVNAKVIENNVAEEASNLENDVSVEDKLEGSTVDFPCTFCDFRSNWANGVKIHIGRKHVDMVQLDGNDSLSELFEDEKYMSIETYLKTGWLGSAYQRYIDALAVIDESSLEADIKTDERGKILDARKCAIGTNFRGFPPWDSS